MSINIIVKDNQRPHREDIRTEGVDPHGNWRRSPEGRRIARSKDWVAGWWDNIAPHPIYIRDKQHLKEVCNKYGVIPKAFMKPKSQGKGTDWNY